MNVLIPASLLPALTVACGGNSDSSPSTGSSAADHTESADHLLGLQEYAEYTCTDGVPRDWLNPSGTWGEAAHKIKLFLPHLKGY